MMRAHKAPAKFYVTRKSCTDKSFGGQKYLWRMDRAEGARLKTSDHIAIALCRNAKATEKSLASHFLVSERQIQRVMAAFPHKYKEIDQAIQKFNHFHELDQAVRQASQDCNLEISDAQVFAADCCQDHDNLVKGRAVVMINRLKDQIRRCKLHLARLKSIRDKEKNQMLPDDYYEALESEHAQPQVEHTILKELVELAPIAPKGRRYSDRLMRFAYCLVTYSPCAYKFARQSLPLPSRSQVYVRFGGSVAQMKQSLTNIDEVYRLVEDFGLKRDNAPPKLVCALGVDAFAFRLFLRQTAPTWQLRAQLSPQQIHAISSLLEDKTLLRMFQDRHIAEEVYEGWPDPDDPTDPISQEMVNQLFASYTHCFIYVLLPLNCEVPCLVVHLEPAPNGAANQKTSDILQQLIDKCALYNIDVPYIAADGDRGWNTKFTAVFDIMQKLPYINISSFSMDVYIECRARNLQVPITDPLHYVKSARSRYIDREIAVTTADPDCQTNCCKAEQVLSVGLALMDKTQIGKMRDFYPLEIFTMSNVLRLLEEEMYADAYYFVPHTLLLLIIRIPFFTMSFRMKLLEAAYLLFAEVYADVSSHTSSSTEDPTDTSTPNITQRHTRHSDMVTFAESCSLKRILCTLVALGSAFQIHPENLRTDSLGTHIVEQKIGQGRADGDARWEKVLSRFSRNSLRTVLMELDHIEINAPGRLKTAGCRVGADADWDLPEFNEVLFCRVFVHSLTEAGRVEDGFAESLEAVKTWIAAIADVVKERAHEIGKVWMPNPAANSSIMARLLQTSLASYSINP